MVRRGLLPALACRRCSGGAVVPEWLVALEAVGGPAGVDLEALARRLGAIGDCRPADRAGSYTLVLRPTDADPAEALRSAVADWRAATVTLGQHQTRLVAARLVSRNEAPPPARAGGGARG